MAEHESSIQSLFLSLLPADGSAVGNKTLRGWLESQLALHEIPFNDETYWQTHAALLAAGTIVKGQGKGGSVRRAQQQGKEPAADDFTLAAQEKPAAAAAPKPAAKKTPTQPAVRANPNEETQIISYRHDDRRKNNPEVGMVNETTDPYQPKTVWKYDPHLDPELQFDSQRAQVENLIDNALSGLTQKDEEILAWLDHALAGQDEKAVREVIGNLRQRLASGVDGETTRKSLEELKRLQSPYLNWAGKAERTSFEVDTVSLHVHERIDPASILSAVRKVMKGEKGKAAPTGQMGLFNASFENLPLRDAIDFYKHDKGWSNRLVAGDSLLVMNSLLHKESMAGQVQMIYIDPPYGIKYGSNFQPFVNKRDVKDRKDEDLTQEPEMIKAFRDTWELGIHSYLTYLRDRLLLARELLHESGSVFVQISDDNLHYVREIMDELFGSSNFLGTITFSKTSSANSPMGKTLFLPEVTDKLVWFSKNREKAKFKHVFLDKSDNVTTDQVFSWIRDESGEKRQITSAEKKDGINNSARVMTRADLTSQTAADSINYQFKFNGSAYHPGSRGWRTHFDGMCRLQKSDRLIVSGQSLRFVQYFDDYPVTPLSNSWTDTATGSFTESKTYVVQTGNKVVERCILMTTDPGDLVLDPTCGSGTTAVAAEKWGRRWITCDTSRVAVTLAKQRLMTASYDYFELKYPHEGLRGGFIYKTVPHVTLKSIANNPEIDTIYETMHPAIVRALAALNGIVGAAPRGRPNEGTHRGAPLQEWEVPFDFPADWPEAARQAFDDFHAARQAMQKKMDASIAAHADQEILYDQPAIAKNKLRITGPFSVEAVPFPTVLSLDEAQQPTEADVSIARSGESHRQHSWRDELLKTGIRGKGGQMLKFTSLETLPGTTCLHCTGTVAETGERVVVSFGPEHGALEQRQVEHALREAGELFPLPKMIVFCAFTFDPEAAKDIDNLKGITALKAQMNTDLLTDDLKKARSSNQSFWLMGQPDVEVRRVSPSPGAGAPPSPRTGEGERELFVVEVNGFDYFNTKTGELEGGGKSKIAVWLLDTDYDERSLLPRQVFFPMAGKGEGWEKLKKNIRAELDDSKLAQFHGTVSLPFEAGENRKIAVKIVDDRGIESLKVIGLPN